MQGLINIKRKRYELIGCCTYYVAFSYELDLGFSRSNLDMLYLRNGRAHWHGTKRMWVDRMLYSHCDFKHWPHPWPYPWIVKVKILKLLYLRNRRIDSLGMKGMWVGYDVGCTMGMTLGHCAWQIDRPSNGSMWNSYSFQHVAKCMSYLLFWIHNCDTRAISKICSHKLSDLTHFIHY